MKEKYRKSVFIVVYIKEADKIKYIILKRRLHWKGWEFPKGGVENNERDKDAVRRETKEETGLTIKNVKRFDFHGKYRYSGKYPDRLGFIGQEYSLYAVEVHKGKVKLDSHEHITYEWLMFNEAIKRLTWRNQKRCLGIVNKWLLNNKVSSLSSNK